MERVMSLSEEDAEALWALYEDEDSAQYANTYDLNRHEGTVKLGIRKGKKGAE
jgi:hypothetical protein